MLYYRINLPWQLLVGFDLVICIGHINRLDIGLKRS